MVWWRFLRKKSGFFRQREITPKYRVFFDKKNIFCILWSQNTTIVSIFNCRKLTWCSRRVETRLLAILIGRTSQLTPLLSPPTGDLKVFYTLLSSSPHMWDSKVFSSLVILYMIMSYENDLNSTLVSYFFEVGDIVALRTLYMERFGRDISFMSMQL